MLNLKSIFYYFLFSSLFLFSACNFEHEIKTTLSSDVNPNSCRITGTIISMEDISNPLRPGSIHPCVAKVKINNVIENGFSFNSLLIKTDTITVKFEFNLSGTSKKLLPKLNYVLPMLNIGDNFVGDIEKVQLVQLDKENQSFEYKIYYYDKVD